SNIFLLVTFFTLGLMISFTIEEAPAIKNESAVDITVASKAIIITMIIVKGSKLPMTSYYTRVGLIFLRFNPTFPNTPIIITNAPITKLKIIDVQYPFVAVFISFAAQKRCHKS